MVKLGNKEVSQGCFNDQKTIFLYVPQVLLYNDNSKLATCG